MDCCRICLVDEADVFLSLFSKSEQIPIAEMVNALTGLKIAKGDGLPRFICKECSEDIQKCYRVRLKCLESDRQLRSTLEKTHEKMKMVEFYLQKEIQKGEPSVAGAAKVEPNSITPEVLKNVITDDKLMGMLPSSSDKQSSVDAATVPSEHIVQHADQINIKQESNTDLIMEKVPEDDVDTNQEERDEQHEEEIEDEENAYLDEEVLDENLASSEKISNEECITSSQNMENMVEEELEYSEVYLEMTDENPEEAQYTITAEDGGSVEHVAIADRVDSDFTQHEYTGKFICCGCKANFSSNEELLQHSSEEHEKMRLKHSAKPFECNICFKRFLSDARLTLHQSYVYREKNHVCDKCNSRFTCRGSLLNHMKTHADRTYFCEDCDKSFHTSSTLKSHRLLHTESKQFKCPAENCDKSFLRKSDLHIHLVSHSDERPFECEVCSARFKSKAHLVHHGKVHTKEKPYKCNQCDKAFGTYSARKFHQLAHEGIHPYKCTYCDKIYQRNTKLQVHIRRIHTGERPFACDMCEEDIRFYQNWELTAHKKKVHNLEVAGQQQHQKMEVDEELDDDDDDGMEDDFEYESKVKRLKSSPK
nr:zinc finger protein 724 [Aedes albopictus]